MYLMEDPDIVEPAEAVATPVETPAETPAEVVSEPAAVVTPPADEDAFAFAKRAFWSDADPDDDAVSVAKSLDVATIGKWDPNTRGEVRAVMGRILREREAEKAALAAERKAIEDARAAQAVEDKRLKRERAAFTQASSNPETIARLRAQAAAKPAVVNPNDPDTLVAAAVAQIAERELEARQPAIQEADLAHRKMARDEAMMEHGLDPEKDVEELNRRIIEMYGSVKTAAAVAEAARANGNPKAVPTYIVVRQMAAERKADAARQERLAEAADRNRAASLLATGSRPGASVMSDEDVIKRVESDPNYDFTAAYKGNPAYKAAIDRLNAA